MTEDPAGGGPTAPAGPTPVGTIDPREGGVAPPRRAGNISMSSGSGTFYANAFFSMAEQNTPAAGACTLTVSRQQTPDVSDNAGDIVIELPSDGKPITSVLAFDAKAQSYEPSMLDAPGQSERVEKANAPIHLRAAGADVPAFDVTVFSAYDTTLIEPAAGASLPADSGDLAVRWSAGGNEVVFATLLVEDTSISCRFAAGAGQGTIPGALIAKAVAGANLSSCGGTCINLLLSGLRTTRITAGDYDVFVSDAATSGVSLMP